MSKLEEKDILGRLKVWRSCAVVYLSELWTTPLSAEISALTPSKYS